MLLTATCQQFIYPHIGLDERVWNCHPPSSFRNVVKNVRYLIKHVLGSEEGKLVTSLEFYTLLFSDTYLGYVFDDYPKQLNFSLFCNIQIQVRYLFILSLQICGNISYTTLANMFCFIYLLMLESPHTYLAHTLLVLSELRKFYFFSVLQYYFCIFNIVLCYFTISKCPGCDWHFLNLLSTSLFKNNNPDKSCSGFLTKDP